MSWCSDKQCSKPYTFLSEGIIYQNLWALGKLFTSYIKTIMIIKIKLYTPGTGCSLVRQCCNKPLWAFNYCSHCVREDDAIWWLKLCFGAVAFPYMQIRHAQYYKHTLRIEYNINIKLQNNKQTTEVTVHRWHLLWGSCTAQLNRTDVCMFLVTHELEILILQISEHLTCISFNGAV